MGFSLKICKYHEELENLKTQNFKRKKSDKSRPLRHVDLPRNF